MIRLFVHHLHPRRQQMPRVPRLTNTMRSPALRWMVLVTLAFGMLFSVIGAASSHGFAVLAAMDHGTGGDLDRTHGHSHGDEGDTSRGVGSEHPHHANDHSHDNPHVLAEGLRAWNLAPSVWHASPHMQAGRLLVFRLERPPRADYRA